MANFGNMIRNSTTKQRVIFCKALYETAPPEAPAETLKQITDDIEFYGGVLSDKEMREVDRAVRILIDVENFPDVDEVRVIDFLYNYN